jgi:hypothetical protein
MNDQPAQKAVASINFNKLEIESDGTRAGTKILLNGKAIENLASLSFTFFNSDYSPVSLGFRVEDQEIKAGTLLGSTYFSLIPPKPDDADASKRAVASVGGKGIHPASVTCHSHRTPSWGCPPECLRADLSPWTNTTSRSAIKPSCGPGRGPGCFAPTRKTLCR